MKKRLSLIMLLVILGAARAQASYYVYDNADTGFSNTLRGELNDSYDDWPGGADLEFTGQYSLYEINYSWLPTIQANHTFFVNNDSDRITLTWHTTTTDNITLLSTAEWDGVDPWLIIPDNFDFIASGVNEVYGIYGEDSLIFRSGLGSDLTLTADGGNTAKALYAHEDIRFDASGEPFPTDGSFYGNIDVSAGEDVAYGIDADESVIVEYDLGGTIKAQAGDDWAHGVVAGEDLIVGHDVSSDVTVIAGNGSFDEQGNRVVDEGDLLWDGQNDWAYGLTASRGSIFIGHGETNPYDLEDNPQDPGDLGGVFNVWALDDNAVGVFTLNGNSRGGDIRVAGDVTATFNVTAGYSGSSANWDYAEGSSKDWNDAAYGILAGDDVIIEGDLGGTFNIQAYDDNARGVSAGYNNNYHELYVGGDVTADMTVIAGNGTVEEPLQLLSEGEGESDPFAGWTVDEENLQDGGDNDGAYGLRASRDIEIVGDLGGSFNIWALDDEAYGVYSSDGNIMAGSVSATINVMAGWDESGEDNSGAYGLRADDNILIAGDYSGSINSKAHSSMPGSAYGMYAGEDIVIGGTFDGSIMASDSLEAYGMYAQGSVSGTGEDALAIQDGVITASVDGEGTAIGILARGGMNLDISGESLISATSQDDGVNGSARALSSPNNYDDTVTIQDSSVLIGNVMLGGGEDVMTVIGTEDGNPDIEQVARLNGGPGPSDDDQLVFRNWSGILGDEVVNWETIDVTEGSVVNLGGSKTDTDNPLSDGDDEPFAAIMSVSPNTIVTMTIDETSEVQAMGESAGDYVLAGDLYNYGHLNLSDGAADDTFRIVADGEDGGGNYYAASDLSLDADLSVSGVDSDEYLDVAGEVSGQTTVTINNVESHVAPTVGDGIGIIFAGDVEDGNDEAFVLGNPNDFGPFAVGIAQVDIPDDGFAWYVQSPGYREEAAVIQAVTPFMNRLGYDSVMKFHERRAYGWFRNDSGEHESWWVRATGSKYRQGMEGDAAAEFEGYTSWMQVGTDLIADGDKGGRFNLGLFAGAGYGWAEVDGLRSDKAGELSQTAYGVGAYMSIHERGNWYLDVVAQAIYNDLAIDYLTENEQNPDAWSYVASLETGGCIPMGTGFRIEPQAQLIYQYTDDINLSTLVGDVSIADHQGLQGRLSLTGVIGEREATVHPFFEVTAIKDFSEDNSVRYLDGSVELKTSPEDWYLGGALGLTRTPKTDAGFGYYVKAAAMYGMEDLDSYNYSLMAGLRKSF